MGHFIPFFLILKGQTMPLYITQGFNYLGYNLQLPLDLWPLDSGQNSKVIIVIINPVATTHGITYNAR